jgi:DNA replication protein DnaC
MLKLATLAVDQDAGGLRFCLRQRSAAQADTELGGLAFIERHENIVLLGPERRRQGAHIASALALKATQAGMKTRFITAADLMIQLALAKAQGRITSI